MGNYADTHGLKSNHDGSQQHCAGVPGRDRDRENSGSTKAMTTRSVRLFPDDSASFTSGATSFQGTSQLKGKLPIPRLTSLEISSEKGRVSRACENCRQQKTKCSGDRPSCRQCEANGLHCLYSCRKREKIEQRLKILEAEVQTLRTLLFELYPGLDASSTQHVHQILEKFPNLSGICPATTSLSKASEYMWSTSNVSTEDFNSDNLQRLGFTGQHSEVSWLHRLRCVVEQRGAGLFTSPSSTQDSLPFISFYQDTTNIGILENIDWIGRPSQSTASELLETYFGKFHDSFPIVGKVPFQAQYRVFYSRADVRPGKQWLAVLNLVFAIATTHLSHIGHRVSSNETHVEFFSRAWKLCMDKDSLRNHPNLQQVQVEGLSAFYLLTRGQINRWVLLIVENLRRRN
ncbi:C6 transcription factor [Penicillium citrinum]|uniref:C6 transcription factor n=1 Tax=Penicillium citrinum TaxID=5077 RepID=A0A9W9PAC4_PENCI|nr:C6 transcription factor [Penicillium citrinum]KAJ5240690.1 C6 transcription factor [Penicillium citrinum]